MDVTGQIVLYKDGLQTNGKNYKIAAISNKNLEKIKYNTVQSQTNKIHMAKSHISLYKTIMKQILAEPSTYQITIIICSYIKA